MSETSKALAEWVHSQPASVAKNSPRGLAVTATYLQKDIEDLTALVNRQAQEIAALRLQKNELRSSLRFVLDSLQDGSLFDKSCEEQFRLAERRAYAS